MKKQYIPVSVYKNYERFLERGKFYGTILLRDNFQYWWSPFVWHDPKYGLEVQPENWCFIGQSTFWVDKKMKSDFMKLKEILGDYLPEFPNEYFEETEIEK
jgi:hypothetical protein